MKTHGTVLSQIPLIHKILRLNRNAVIPSCPLRAHRIIGDHRDNSNSGLIAVVGLEKCRDQAKNIVCTGNLKQLGIAVLMYANDFDGMAPCSRADCKSPVWIAH